MMLRNLLPLLPLAAALTAGLAQAATPDAILGTWSPDNGHDSRIEINKCGDRYCGAIVWMRMPRSDDNNVDPTLRKRPLVAVMVMKNFKFEGGAIWGGGKLYVPDRGKIADAKFVMLNKNEIEIEESFGEAKKKVMWKRVVM